MFLFWVESSDSATLVPAPLSGIWESLCFEACFSEFFHRLRLTSMFAVVFQIRRLAFSSMLDAAVFSVLLQRKLPLLPWPDELRQRGRLGRIFLRSRACKSFGVLASDLRDALMRTLAFRLNILIKNLKALHEQKAPILSAMLNS